MYLQTLLLPAILFTQSSLAYYCCFQVSGRGGHVHMSKFFENGAIADDWNPVPLCLIRITKTGENCSKWTWKILDATCPGLWPVKTVGPVTADVCKPL